ncbi:hypothetical protein U1Q18_051836 [Sarracenia purpurea var. burkii]
MPQQRQDSGEVEAEDDIESGDVGAKTDWEETDSEEDEVEDEDVLSEEQENAEGEVDIVLRNEKALVPGHQNPDPKFLSDSKVVYFLNTNCLDDNCKFQTGQNETPTGHALKLFDEKPNLSLKAKSKDWVEGLEYPKISMSKSPQLQRKRADFVSGAQTIATKQEQPINNTRSGMELEYISLSDNCSGIIDIDDDMIDEKP